MTAVALAAPVSATASPPSVPAPFPAVSGQVNTILVDGNTAYIGGSFHALGHPTGPMSVLSRATGEVVRSYRDIAGNPGGSTTQPRVTAVEPDGAGGWYAAGNFEVAGDVEHHSLLHLRPDGSIDHDFEVEVDGKIAALAPHGDTLWIGGTFTRVGGQAQSRLAAVDARTGAVLPPRPAQSTSVGVLTIAGDRLYVGGGGAAIARDVETGALLPWNAQTSGGSVYEIEVAGDTVYVGGTFYAAGGESRQSAAALRASDGSALPVDFGLDDYASIGEIEATDDIVVLGGGLTGPGDSDPDLALAAYDRDTLAKLPLFDGVDGGVSAMALAGSTLYVHGVGPAPGVLGFGLAAFDLPSGTRRAWGPGPTVGGVVDLAVVGDRVVAAGTLLVDSVNRWSAAAIDLRTGEILPWNPDPQPMVFGNYPVVDALVKHGDEVIIGGTFKFLGDQNHEYLAAVDAVTGALRPGAVPEATYPVKALATDGSTLYVGGDFWALGTQDRLRLGAVNLTDGSVLPFAPRIDCAVETLAVSARTLHVGGCFDRVDGQPVTNLVSFDLATGARSTTFTAQTDSDVTAVVPDGSGGVWVGGEFDQFAGRPQPGLGRLDAAGRDDPSVPAVDGNPYAIVPVGNEVFLAGVGSIGGVPRDSIGSFDATTGAVSDFDPQPDGPVFAIAALPGDGLLVGGNFTTFWWRSGASLARFGGEISGDADPGGEDAPAPATVAPSGGGRQTRGAPAGPTRLQAVQVRIARDPARRMLRRGVRVRVFAAAAARVRVELRAGRRLVGRRTVTIAPGRWETVRVRVRRGGRLRAVVRDAATAAVLARSAPLRLGR